MGDKEKEKKGGGGGLALFSLLLSPPHFVSATRVISMGDKVKMTGVSVLDSNSFLIFHLLRLCPTQKQIVTSTDSTVSNDAGPANARLCCTREF